MARAGFRGGFAWGTLAGAAAGLAGFWLASGRASSYDSRILRLERSIQIGRPMEEVYGAWSHFESLPERVSLLREVTVRGDESTWRMQIDGRSFQFKAITSQLLANQAIGWKSVCGPKHSGRVNFARLGNDTLVHVSMNYAPPLGRLGRLLAPVTDHLESKIDEALRDFKRSLEEPGASGRGRSATEIANDRWHGHAPASAGWDEPNAERATGTEGGRQRNPLEAPGAHLENAGGRVRNPGAVDYTRPPENR